MKETLQFDLGKNGYYHCKKADSPEAQILGMFLDTDVSLRPDTPFTDWLDDPKISSIQGNVIEIDLLEDETIEIRDSFDEGDIDDPVFRMPKEEYRKMIEQWRKMARQRPKKIIVSWDGKEITVEGRG